MSLLLLGAGPSAPKPANIITNGTFVNGDQDWEFINAGGWEIVTGDPGYAKFDAPTNGTYFLFQTHAVEVGDYRMTCTAYIDEGAADGLMLFSGDAGVADTQFIINTTEPTIYETTITNSAADENRTIRWRGAFGNQPWYITNLSYVKI
jgi:hypothetical protein